MGALRPDRAVRWRGPCFADTLAFLNLTGGAGGRRGGASTGGAVINLVTSGAHSWTCVDLYLFVTPYRVTWDYYFFASHHKLAIPEFQDDAELDYVLQKGLAVFLMPAGALGTLRALWDVAPLFANGALGEAANMAFLKRRMGAEFVPVRAPYHVNVSEADIHSGDFLVLSKLRGRWGGFETLEKWVSGAWGGHTAMAIRDDADRLWVAEAGHQNAKGEEEIILLAWDEWWRLQLLDPADPHIVLLPLHPRLRERWDSAKAWAFVRSMVGRPYGYHNLFFAWIDTTASNFPPPLDDHLVAAIVAVWQRLQPEYASNLWNEALNLRLGTRGLDMPGILAECARRGLRFGELMAVPESDSWIYSDGRSTTCVAFVMATYKAAGLFGLAGDGIQVTEFTIRDAYMLDFYNSEAAGVPSWCNLVEGGGGKGGPGFCHLLGKWRMDLPGYNSIHPYPHMAERCPSMPPDYYRPSHC
eukprot:SM000162S02394  [mRNA]  locus=s162:280670:283014:- [translate_table: standard]